MNNEQLNENRETWEEPRPNIEMERVDDRARQPGPLTALEGVSAVLSADASPIVAPRSARQAR